MSILRKKYKALTGGTLSFSRSKLTDSGARVSLPPIEIPKNGAYITSDKEKISFLDNHPWFGKHFVVVDEESVEPHVPKQPEPKALIEDLPQVDVEVKTLNEARDYLAENGIDIHNLRSWDAVIAEGEKNGIKLKKI